MRRRFSCGNAQIRTILYTEKFQLFSVKRDDFLTSYLDFFSKKARKSLKHTLECVLDLLDGFINVLRRVSGRHTGCIN